VTVDHARAYLAAGWHPIPLAAGTKWPPPSGVTGWRGRYLTTTDGYDWSGNIALRLPPDVVGVDVDVYAGGDVSLKDLEQRYGPLPTTWWSTSRGDGSGIALLRVPNGTTLLTDPAEGIDMIQAFHRYVVCSPSIHPEGRAYRWIDELGDEDVDVPPHPGDLPELPWPWIEALATHKTGASEAATPEDARGFIEANTAAARVRALDAVIRSLADVTVGGRHDALVRAACWLAREAAAGWYPAADAFDRLHGWWINAVADDPRRRDGGEFGAAVLWAIGQALADPERIKALRDELGDRTTSSDQPPPHTDDDAPPEDPRGSFRNLPEQFWTARPELGRIRDAAHARARSADAVLGAVLARVAMMVPPTLRVDTGVVNPACLNTYVGLVAQSGGGKTSAAAVARDLVPITREDLVVDMPLGSGEGVIEMFYEWQLEEQPPDGKKVKVKRQTKNGVLLTLDEGQALTELGGRNGATLLPVLRSAWSGEVIGMSNAREETKRRLEVHSYRLCFIVGFQASAAGAILADQERGTAQRFVLFSTVDPTIPEAAPAWPEGPVLADVPATIPDQKITVAAEVGKEIRTRALAVARGELVLDPLDSHRDLSRARVGALLAVLASRREVTVDDWQLAGMILDTSDAVRRWVLDTNAAAENQIEDARTRAAVKRQRIAANALEDDVHARAVAAGARAIARLAHRRAGETITTREARHAVAGKHRHEANVEEMLDHAAASDWIRADGDGWVAAGSRPA
jgi:Bifunctional DNA primase/polymerase, N-terminal